MRANPALPGIFPIPEEITNATLETDPRKHVRCAEVVVNRAQAIIVEYGFPELIQPLAARKLTGGNDHRQIAWLQGLGLLDEQLIDRRGAGAETAIAQLIRRIANDDVELHGVPE